MNFKAVLETLEEGVAVVEKLAPLAAAIGGPVVGNVANVVLTVSDIAHNVVNRAVEVEHVFSSEDLEAINTMLNKLSVQNDKLAEAIRNS